MDTPLESEMHEYEIDFRNFRKQILEETERKFKMERAQFEAQQEVESRIHQRTQPLIAGGDDTQKVLRELEESEVEHMVQHVETVKKKFAEREAHLDARLREELGHKLLYSNPGYHQAPLIGADVIALDLERLDQYEGEMGNPSKWFYDANKHWKGKISYTGQGGCSGGTPYHPLGTIWYYTWTPPKKGKYSVLSITPYHGSYVLYSFILPYMYCSYAAVHASIEIRIGVKKPPYKYPVGIASEKRDIIQLGGSSILKSAVLDGAVYNTATVDYQTTGPLYINVLVSLSVTAKGSPSYSELNFQDGAANYITAPFVALWSV